MEDSLSLEVSRQKNKEIEKQKLLSELKMLEREEEKLMEIDRYKRPQEEER